MKATLHKKLTLLLGFGTVCERMCACVQLHSLDAGRCLMWWVNWALLHSPSPEGTEHIYMVSCICKAAYWREDDLKKLCGSVGSTQRGPWNVEHQLCAERQPAR